MGAAARGARRPGRNRLAVHTEDHPLDYIDFAGEIPKGEYGGGKVAIWDRGTYEAEKWEEGKVDRPARTASAFGAATRSFAPAARTG